MQLVSGCKRGGIGFGLIESISNYVNFVLLMLLDHSLAFSKRKQNSQFKRI